MSELPTSWSWSTIGDLSQYIQRGKSPKYADKSELPVINQKCIRWNELQVQYLKFIHPDQFSAWDSARYIAPGDILWNSTGTGTVGRAYQVKEADCVPPKVVDSHVTIVRHIPAIDARYLFNWIKGPLVQGKIEEMCDGTTNQIELSRTAIAATAIPIAPATEQIRIANQLDTLLTRIQACNDRFDAIPALLKRFRNSVLAAAVSGRLTNDLRSEDLSTAKATSSSLWQIPASWKWARAEDVTGFITKGTTPSKEKMTSGRGEVPYIKVYNLGFDGRVDFTVDPTFVDSATHSIDLKRSITLPGDVLMNIVGPPLGKVAIVSDSHPEWNINQAIARFRPVQGLLSSYLANCLMSTELIAYAVSQAKATVGQLNLTLEICRALPIPIPPEKEQTEIVRRVEALFALADRIEARCATARAQAQRLSPLVLAKAFRGELVQQDPQDEPASVLLQRIAAAQPAKVQTSRGRRDSQQETHPSLVPVLQPDWTVLPDGAWAAPADPDGHAAVALLAAVLKAWGHPMPQIQTRLATLMCQQPRLFTAVLPADQAAQWRRLVGAAANPLPAQVASFQPATNSHWRRALVGMRARGDLIESGIGPQETWVLGPGAAHIETAGWPEGRAEWVVAYLRAHGMEAVLPLLAPAAQEFVNVKAA